MKNNFIRLSLGLVVFVCFSTPLWALEVKREGVIDAPVDVVWARIGGWCSLKDWHPNVTGCLKIKNKRLSQRVVNLSNGGVIVNQLTKVEEASYSYSIVTGPLPVADYNSTLSVISVGTNKTKVIWRATFMARGVPDAEAERAVKNAYNIGLKAIEILFGEAQRIIPFATGRIYP